MPAQFQASGKTETIKADDGGFSGGSAPETKSSDVEVEQTPVEAPVEIQEQTTEVEQTTETTNEDSQKKPVNFADFNTRRQGVELKAPEKKEEKVEVKSDSAPENKDKQEPDKQTISRESVLKELGIPEDQHKLYKFMSNDAFNTVKGLLAENKQLKSDVEKIKTTQPARVEPTIDLYGNPNGYLLDPQYQTLSRQATLAESALNHYAAQLDKIASGEVWQDLESDKDGNLYIVEKDIEPTERARIAINERIRTIQEIKIQAASKVNDIQSNYGNRAKQDIDIIRQAETKFFPDYDKDDHWSKPIQKEFINLLPPSQRNNPLASSMAKMAANNSQLKTNWEKSEKRAVEAEKKVKELEDKIKGIGNPQSPTKNKFSAGSTNGTRTVSFKDFEKARYGI